MAIRRSAVRCARQLGVYSGLSQKAEEAEEVFVRRPPRRRPVERTVSVQRESIVDSLQGSYSGFSHDKLFSDGAAKIYGFMPEHMRSESSDLPDDSVLRFGRSRREEQDDSPQHSSSSRDFSEDFPRSSSESLSDGVFSTRVDWEEDDDSLDRKRARNAARKSPIPRFSPSSSEAYEDFRDYKRIVDTSFSESSFRVSRTKEEPPEARRPRRDTTRRRNIPDCYDDLQAPGSLRDNRPRSTDDGFRSSYDDSSAGGGFRGLKQGSASCDEASVRGLSSDSPGSRSVDRSAIGRYARTSPADETQEPAPGASSSSNTRSGKDSPSTAAYTPAKAYREETPPNASRSVCLSASIEHSADNMIKDSLATMVMAASSLPTNRPLSLVARNVLMSLKHSDRRGYMELLQPWHGLVKEQDAIEVMGMLENGNVMTQFFNWLEKQHNFRHNVFTYNAYLNALVKVGDAGRVLEQFRRMINDDIFPDKYTYGIVIRGLCVAKKMQDAMKVAQDMEMKRVGPSSLVANFLIAGLCQAGMVKEAFTYFTNMDDRCSADVISYNLLIHGLCKVNQVDKAMRLFATMIGRKMEPTMITYNCVLYGLCKAGRLKEAVSLVSEMSDGVRGRDIAPDVFTFNTVIDGLCKINDLPRARFVLRKMMSLNVAATVVTYNTLINALCKVGKVGEAEEIFKHMQSKEVKPTVVTYTSMIHGHCKANLLDKAKEYFEDMDKAGIPANVYTYTALIRGLCDADQVNEAVKLLSQMYTKGVCPNVITYTTLVTSLCRLGETDKASRIFNDMLKRKQVEPDAFAFITIIQGLCKHKKFLESYQYLKKMVTIYQLSPDLMVCATLADGLEGLGEHEKLEDVCRMSESRGLVLPQVNLSVQESTHEVA